MLSASLRILIVPALCLILSGLAADAYAQTGAAPAPAGKQTIIAVNLRDPDFRIWNIKFRMFYNKTETEAIPVKDFDFKASLSDELVNTLAADTRAQWRLPQGDEMLYLASYFDEKTSQGSLPASVKADRLLLVDVGQYALWTHSSAHRLIVLSEVRLLDRASNRILWKKKVTRKLEGYKRRKEEELLADNQKLLKELLNKLIEEYCVEVKKKVAEKPI
jgi:hypothetical protein